MLSRILSFSSFGLISPSPIASPQLSSPAPRAASWSCRPCAFCPPWSRARQRLYSLPSGNEYTPMPSGWQEELAHARSSLLPPANRPRLALVRAGQDARMPVDRRRASVRRECASVRGSVHPPLLPVFVPKAGCFGSSVKSLNSRLIASATNDEPADSMAIPAHRCAVCCDASQRQAAILRNRVSLG
jgi:hypothetical protein